MNRGLLSDHFKGVVFKTLSAVEADTLRSNQHEYNGTTPLRRLFGPRERKNIIARFLYLDDIDDQISDDGFLTWYDARIRTPNRTEFRLYFPSNAVTRKSRVGDGVFIALRPDDEAMVIVAPAGSSIRAQLVWLFGLDSEQDQGFEGRQFDANAPETGFVARLILDELGIEAEGPAEARLDALVDQFGLTFPPTREFSALARSSLPEVNPLDDPDLALMAWIEREEQLFRRLERRIVAERLTAGFVGGGEVDVDGFLSFSLSVQNRRKSRAGSALENHLAVLFTAFGLQFGHGVETENRNRPDFLFPGQAAYRDPGFPDDGLLMLGSKTTCKDRWRQVLSEAERIKAKHLLTLEPGISRTQTDEMLAKRLQLVLPSAIHTTYQAAQREQLMDVRAFLDLAIALQKSLRGP